MRKDFQINCQTLIEYIINTSIILKTNISNGRQTVLQSIRKSYSTYYVHSVIILIQAPDGGLSFLENVAKWFVYN